MRISFDIDGLLTPEAHALAVEPALVPRWVIRWLAEPLRAGTRDLITTLQSQGHDVCIYTTSTRSPRYVRRWLRLHGIRLTRVINADEHATALRAARLRGSPSKYPPHFGIDLHIDDSPGVEAEGRKFGFEVLVVASTEVEWGRVVRARVGGATIRCGVEGD